MKRRNRFSAHHLLNEFVISLNESFVHRRAAVILREEEIERERNRNRKRKRRRDRKSFSCERRVMLCRGEDNDRTARSNGENRRSIVTTISLDRE